MIELVIECAAAKFGVDRLGFLTLTFPDQVECKREASRRFNSLRTNVLKDRYPGGIVVWERQRSGRLHAHCLVVCTSDIRTGVNFAEIASRRYVSATPALRDEWRFWRETAPRYKFGRTELLPVKTEGGAIANYIGKYLSKDIVLDVDKGYRRYACWGVLAGIANQQHQTVYASYWRAACAEFARDSARNFGCPPTWDAMTQVHGASWVWEFRHQLAERADRLRREAHGLQSASVGLSERR